MNLQQTSKEYFRSLIVIYIAIISSQVLFGLLVFYLNQSGIFNNQGIELNSVFKFIVPLLVLAGIIGSNALFKNRLKSAKEKTDLIEKMILYRSSLVMRFAILEVPSFFSLIIYLLTSNLKYLAYSGLIIFVYLTMRPGKTAAETDLELSPYEKEKINDPDAIISVTRDNK